jgi:hypothetical protein
MTAAPDFDYVELDKIIVKGRARPLRIYTALGKSVPELAREGFSRIFWHWLSGSSPIVTASLCVFGANRVPRKQSLCDRSATPSNWA